jgi:hypothetical protein
MATTVPESDIAVRDLTREESRAILDQQARRYFHMSGEEFIRAWESGQFDDDPDRPYLMRVAMLVPFAK